MAEDILVENWGGDDDDPWDATRWVTGVASSATIDIQDNQGRLAFPSSFDARAWGYSLVSATDAEVVLEFAFPAAGGTPDGRLMVCLRSTTTDDDVGSTANGYELRVSSRDGQPAELNVISSGSRSTLDSTSFDPTSGTTYRLRFRVEGSTIRAKWWDTAGSEPGSWIFSETDTTHTGAGYLWVGFRRIGSSREVRVDNLTLTDLDAEPPPPIDGSGTLVEGNDTATGAGLFIPYGIKAAVALEGGDGRTLSVLHSDVDSNISAATVIAGGSARTLRILHSGPLGGISAAVALGDLATEPDYEATGEITEGDDTAAGTGTFVVPAYSGTGTITEGDDTLDGTGTFTVPSYSGTGTITEGDDTLDGTGTFTVPAYSGTGTITEGDDTAQGDGTFTGPSYSGSGTLVEGDDTLTGVGMFEVSGFAGMGTITEGDDVATGMGTHVVPTYEGSGTLTEGDDTAEGIGHFEAVVHSGSGALVEEDDTASGTGTYTPLPAVGAGEIIEGDDTLGGAGEFTRPSYLGAGSLVEEPDVMAGTGIVANPMLGAGAITEADDVMLGEGTFTRSLIPDFGTPGVFWIPGTGLPVGEGAMLEPFDTARGLGTYTHPITTPGVFTSPVFVGQGNMVEEDDVLVGVGES